MERLDLHLLRSKLLALRALNRAIANDYDLLPKDHECGQALAYLAEDIAADACDLIEKLVT